MDRTMELDHLAIAEKAIARGERHIAREEQMIADLDRAGHDTKQALMMLATYRKLQAQHVAHRDQILKMLQQEGSKDAIFRPSHYDPAPQPKQTLSARYCSRHP